MMPQNRRIAKPGLTDPVLNEDDPSTMQAMSTGGRWRSPRVQKVFAVARAVVGGLLVVGLSTVVAWGARRHILTSPRFAVVDIVGSGAKLRSLDDLAKEGGIAKGANIFSVDLDQARARILSDPWIREASLARRLPGTIVLQVTEREAEAIVALKESYLADQDGEIFKRLEPSDPTGLSVITGISEDDLASDRPEVTKVIRRALDLATDFAHGPLATKSELEEIHLGAGGSVTLIVGKDAVALEMGVPPFRKKLEEAYRVLGELDRRGVRPGVILLDNEARPERVVVRMR